MQSLDAAPHLGAGSRLISGCSLHRPPGWQSPLCHSRQDPSVTPVWSFMCSVADVGLVSECMYHIVKAGYIPRWSFLRPGHMFGTRVCLEIRGNKSVCLRVSVSFRNNVLNCRNNLCIWYLSGYRLFEFGKYEKIWQLELWFRVTMCN